MYYESIIPFCCVSNFFFFDLVNFVKSKFIISHTVFLGGVFVYIFFYCIFIFSHHFKLKNLILYEKFLY